MNCWKTKCIGISLASPSNELGNLRKYAKQIKECEKCVKMCSWKIDCYIKEKTLDRLRKVLELSRKKYLHW